MDAGGSNVFTPSLRSPSIPRGEGDRYIPLRSAIDFDFAHFALTESRRKEANSDVSSDYRKVLSQVLLDNRTRILAFRSRPPRRDDPFLSESPCNYQVLPSKRPRYIPQAPERSLAAPGLVNDFFLNLLDWGSKNILAIALGDTVHLWDATTGSAFELITVDDADGPVTSVGWAPDGRRIAIGLNNSNIQLWDSSTKQLLRTFTGVHGSRVGSLAWNNNNMLSTGGMDGKIAHLDVQSQSHPMHIYRGHNDEVCGLKWSGSGQQLASGGSDSLLHIWDLSMASSVAPRGQNQWTHRFDNHTAAVKGLAWCPFQSNLLASGGGRNDRCIKFWNTNTGACLNSIDTGSQVCSLLWSEHKRELLSSHGFPENQLTLWKYPSMAKITELTVHSQPVLFTTKSPDGCTVVSASGDETLRFWAVFEAPEVRKPAATATSGFLSHNNYLR